MFQSLTHVHLGFKLCTLILEVGPGQLEDVACNFGFNKFVGCV